MHWSYCSLALSHHMMHRNWLLILEYCCKFAALAGPGLNSLFMIIHSVILVQYPVAVSYCISLCMTAICCNKPLASGSFSERSVPLWGQRPRQCHWHYMGMAWSENIQNVCPAENQVKVSWQNICTCQWSWLIIWENNNILLEYWGVAVDFFLPCVDELVQEKCNSSASAMELRLSCTDPSLYSMEHSAVHTV